jgi:hypothetical protein
VGNVLSAHDNECWVPHQEQDLLGTDSIQCALSYGTECQYYLQLPTGTY